MKAILFLQKLGFFFFLTPGALPLQDQILCMCSCIVTYILFFCLFVQTTLTNFSYIVNHRTVS